MKNKQEIIDRQLDEIAFLQREVEVKETKNIHMQRTLDAISGQNKELRKSLSDAEDRLEKASTVAGRLAIKLEIVGVKL